MGVSPAANGLSFCFRCWDVDGIRAGLNRTLARYSLLYAGCDLLVNDRRWKRSSGHALLKGSTALNVPCKEILYQPTSSNVKFKAKSWIDVFGARGSKALGVVTNAFSDSAADLQLRRVRRHERRILLIYVACGRAASSTTARWRREARRGARAGALQCAADDDGEGTSRRARGGGGTTGASRRSKSSIAV